MRGFEIKILGVSETHFNRDTPASFDFENSFISQSSRKDKIRRQGVAIVIENEWANCISSYKCISERFMSVSFDTMDGSLTIFQLYAPTSVIKTNYIKSSKTLYNKN